MLGGLPGGAVVKGAVLQRQPSGVSSDTSVWLASGVDGCCVKKQCGLVRLCIGGRMTFNLRLCRARTGVVAMRQDSSY